MLSRYVPPLCPLSDIQSSICVHPSPSFPHHKIHIFNSQRKQHHKNVSISILPLSSLSIRCFNNLTDFSGNILFNYIKHIVTSAIFTLYESLDMFLNNYTLFSPSVSYCFHRFSILFSFLTYSSLIYLTFWRDSSDNLLSILYLMKPRYWYYQKVGVGNKKRRKLVKLLSL